MKTIVTLILIIIISQVISFQVISCKNDNPWDYPSSTDDYKKNDVFHIAEIIYIILLLVFFKLFYKFYYKIPKRTR